MIPHLAILLVHPVIAAIEGADAEASQVSFQTAMLLVVVVVLGFMGKKLADLGRTVRDLEDRLAGGTAPSAPASHGAVVSQDASADVDTEAAVVIAATVAALWGPSARIISMGEPRAGVRMWAIEGRRQIFASHKIR